MILLSYPKKLASNVGVTFVASAVSMLLGFPVSVIYWDGKQSRDFTLAKNVVDTNILSCELNKIGVFNIACGRRITINQSVSYTNKIRGKEMKSVYADPRTGDLKYSLASVQIHDPHLNCIIKLSFKTRSEIIKII